MPRSHKGGADGVVSSAGLSKGRRTDHPVRDKSERIHFLDVAATPPLRGGECARRKTLSKKLKVAALLHKKSQKYEHTRSKTLHRSLLGRRSCTHNLALHRDSQRIAGVRSQMARERPHATGRSIGEAVGGEAGHPEKQARGLLSPGSHTTSVT